MSDTVTNSVRVTRNKLGLTQQELADSTQVTRQTIIAIEKGNYIPSVLLSLRLAKSLKTKVEKLFKEKK